MDLTWSWVTLPTSLQCPPRCFTARGRSYPASLLTISPEAVTGGVPPQGLAVTCRIRTEVINCPPLTDDNTGPPGPGHTDVDPPGLGEEAELPGAVGPDHAQDDNLLLPALVAVHSPHLHPAQTLRLPQQAPGV